MVFFTGLLKGWWRFLISSLVVLGFVCCLVVDIQYTFLPSK